MGIDPGTLRTGYGIIEVSGKHLIPVHFGCIFNLSKTPLPQRFARIFESLCSVIEKFQPDSVAIEAMFYCKNPSTAIKLGEARGIAMLSAARNNLQVFEYEPRRVKQAVVGYGSADKSQVRRMVTTLLSLAGLEGPEDITDALAIAICHAHLTSGRDSRKAVVSREG